MRVSRESDVCASPDSQPAVAGYRSGVAADEDGVLVCRVDVPTNVAEVADTMALQGLVVTADLTHILGMSFIVVGQKPPLCPAEPRSPLLLQAAQQISEYLAGRRRTFSLPVRAAGTVFQHRVWAAIAAIPYGETRTYAEIGMMLGDARLARAVGSAANRNPLPLIVPCHRVIGSRGDLVGFASGTAIKAYLLALEQWAIAGTAGG